MKTMNYEAGMILAYADIIRYVINVSFGGDIMLVSLPDGSATVIDRDDHEIMFDPTTNVRQLARNLKKATSNKISIETAEMFAKHILN